MQNSDKRTKLICFRVTEEQHKAVQALAVLRGARSVSDFARDYILAASASPPSLLPGTATSASQDQLEVLAGKFLAAVEKLVDQKVGAARPASGAPEEHTPVSH